jgi:deoxyribose-phosphate aldolase
MTMIAIHSTLDAAILKPEMTTTEVEEALDLCLRYRTATACVRPCDISLARKRLAGSGVGVCSVLAFPHGSCLSATKAAEAAHHIELGVDEIDMVANFGWIRSANWAAVQRDIESVAKLTRSAKVPLKVIFETCHLNASAIAKVVEICVAAGADYVKTSTGFNGSGADPEVVRLMLEAADGRIKVKPSGGIRDAATARRYLDMGAARLGVGYSSVPAICGDAAASAGSGY